MEFSVGLLATVAGILGTLISVFASLVPLRMFFSLRSCEGSETGHYVDAIFSSGLWAAYAFYTNQPIVLFGNVFSFSIQTIFVCLSLYLAPNKAQVSAGPAERASQ
ncbi:bidirectional sugar transporter SWEET13 [Arabidopsis lyrata subsp. lyrata]|uniref:bidirectional sugar transporter SWEET13 n=1 Tax=Arabidopsis lyrata subsp. lyrata TaxID=81972 RepID=UPI000A29CCA6|nr:bidirectional sugar transporter SWEET13 [Arabidopsis lyrata subsp. lyrata]|eukprot:XP_020878665.1 bidirectional sugar transporter SWEET13 [Arabidopsis lyrata subsp. lyrata]